ncbi:MAG TPA: hypothetical protein VGK92_09445 [Gaiellales bacterium]|jgi:hypothetical protein
MPQNNSNATGAATGAAPGQRLERIATGLRSARLRAGLDERRVVELLARQGLEVSLQTLLRWEESGLIHVDAAVQLADAYGTTLDMLAGRRAYAPRHPNDDLPPAPRSAW